MLWALVDGLRVKPVVNCGGSETPKFAHLNSRNLAITSHFLKSLGMDFQQCSRLLAVEEWLKFWRVCLGCLNWLPFRVIHESPWASHKLSASLSDMYYMSRTQFHTRYLRNDKDLRRS